MPEVAGTIKCPVCGREMQEIRVNKNRNLYIYCENGCKTVYSAAVSRKALPTLKSGRVFLYNVQTMHPLVNQQIEHSKEEVKHDTGNRGIAIDRRPDAGLAGSNGNQPARKSRGFLAEFFLDDDDTED